MSEDSRFVVIKSDDNRLYGVLNNLTGKVAPCHVLNTARIMLTRCVDGHLPYAWIPLLEFGNWSVVPDQSDKPDQLLPPGSFKPPTRADFKDDSVPSGDAAPSRYVLVYASEDTYAVYDQFKQRLAAVDGRGLATIALQQCLEGADDRLFWATVDEFEDVYGSWEILPSGDAVPSTQTPVYAVNVDLPELATKLTVNRDKYITYTDANSDFSVDKRRDTYIDCLQQGASLGAVCDHVPSGDSVPKSKPTPPRFTFVRTKGPSVMYGVLDRNLHVIAPSIDFDRVVTIKRACEDGSDLVHFRWLLLADAVANYGVWDAMSEEDIQAATRSADKQQPRYVIVQANNDRRSYAVWDQDKCRMAPVGTLTPVVEMWQRCVNGTDNLCWITVDQFKKSYGDWSVITQLGEVIDSSDVVPVMPTFKVGDWVKATREDLSSERAWKKGDIGRIVVADSPLSCVVEFVNQGKRKLHNGRFRICHGYLVHTNRPSDSPNGTDSQITGTGGKSPAGVFTDSPSGTGSLSGTGSCVGASAKPSGHRQLPITSDDATQQFSMATVVGGQYRGRWAIIYVEFADGLCLVELDQKQTMEEEICVIHRDFLLIWATCLATAERKE